MIAIKLTGLPYTREIVQILAIHIFHKLVRYNLYNEYGQRKNPDQRQSLPIDYLPGHVGAVCNQVVNAAFNSDIEEIVENLNNCQTHIIFDKNDIIEDVLLNPGPADENIDIIVH